MISHQTGVLLALLLLIGGSLWLGALAQRTIQNQAFLKGFFLGNRSIGSWAMALTATVQSGGTFIGFPSLVYRFGWIVSLWIASYMMVPITGFAILGKRLAQISRKTGAITVPDFFRERFASPRLGLVASIMLLVYMICMMIAQFKAGAIILKACLPGGGVLTLSEETTGAIGADFYIGLVVFTVVVVSYTIVGGFLAAVWTDLFQSLLMLLGVCLLLPLSLRLVGGMEQATLSAVQNFGSDHYVYGPGQSTKDNVLSFLPLGLAISQYVLWVFAGFGSPASMVRVMAARDTQTLRRSIFLLAVYNTLIYLPLIVICICARAVFPDLGDSDEVIPRMTLLTTKDVPGGALLAGVILSAPFGAVMSTVSSFLVVIASGMVRDIYHRFVDPEASDHTLRRLTTYSMIGVGGIGILANIRPIDYLQAMVVFSATSSAAAFVAPAIMAAYWRRANAAGALAAMLAGTVTVLGLYATGWTLRATIGYRPPCGIPSKFSPYYLGGLDPIVWGLLVSTIFGIVVSLYTKPAPAELVNRLFPCETSQESNRTPSQKGAAP